MVVQGLVVTGSIYMSLLLACLVILVLVFLLYYAFPIVFPTIWTYPWPKQSSNNDDDNEDKKKIVLLAGSFNPPHLGHVEMIQYLACRYGEVIVVVGHNANKKYAVSPEQRAELLRHCLSRTNNTNIQVQTVAGYIWRHVPQAKIFFRGIRSWEKDGADERALQILNTWGPVVCGPFWWPRTTYFLQGNPKYKHISSTWIRDLCSSASKTTTTTTTTNDKPLLLTELVPECIAERIRDLYTKKHQD